jgi:hypothetical protein
MRPCNLLLRRNQGRDLAEIQCGLGCDPLTSVILSKGVALKEFQFEDQGHKFRCERGSSPGTPGVDWWWISLDGDAQRYAAFRSEPGDTIASLKPRVVAFYAEVLAIRARPRILRPSWSQRKPAAEAGAAAAAAKPAEPAP